MMGFDTRFALLVQSATASLTCVTISWVLTTSPVCLLAHNKRAVWRRNFESRLTSFHSSVSHHPNSYRRILFGSVLVQHIRCSYCCRTWVHVRTLPSINFYLGHQTKAWFGAAVPVNRGCLFEIIIYPNYITEYILNLALSLEFVRWNNLDRL